MADEVLGDSEVFLLVKTRTRCDVGSWFVRARVCAAMSADELVLLASEGKPPPRQHTHFAWRDLWRHAVSETWRLVCLLTSGRAPHVERIPLSRLGESVYNHVTGELILAPAEHAQVRRLRVSPLDGYQMLAQIHREDTHGA